MSYRFNFYDLYAYLIPGLTLVALLVGPVYFVIGALPNVGVANAVTGLIAAYLVGHVLYSVTAQAFPPGQREKGRIRFPSDDYMDRERNPHRSELILQLEMLAKDYFGIDLSGKTNDRDKKVAEFFLLARADVVGKGRGAYAEQFQGMFSMMRGVGAAALLGAYNCIGWLVGATRLGGSGGRPVWRLSLILVMIMVTIIVLDLRWYRQIASLTRAVPSRLESWIAACRQHWSEAVFVMLAAACGYAGFVASSITAPNLTELNVLTVLELTLLFVAGRFFRTFEYFAKLFAETVYRDFISVSKSAPKIGYSRFPPLS